jgi:hypothetical protein
MAFLSSGIKFEGLLGDVSAYRMKGSDRIVVRMKGGASKKKIKTAASMVNTRRTMSEFGAASRASSRVLRMIKHRGGWSTHGVQGALTAVMMHLRRSDTESTWGQRGILFSRNPKLLEGFSLNKGEKTFDNCINSPIRATLSREGLSARIVIPALIPGVNLTLPEDRPQYRLVAELITVPDFIFVQEHNRFDPMSDYSYFDSVNIETDWYTSRNGSSEATLDLNLEVVPPNEHFGLMLTIGLQLGVKHEGDTVELVKKAGAAKVLAMI